MRERHVYRVEEEERRNSWVKSGQLRRRLLPPTIGSFSMGILRQVRGYCYLLRHILTNNYRGSGEVQYLQVEQERRGWWSRTPGQGI